MKFLISIVCVLFLTSCKDEFKVQGTVERTEMGKDKYMLFMKDEKGQQYRVLVSRTAMGKHYKDVASGQQIELTGDTTHWQNEVHVNATGIKVLN